MSSRAFHLREAYKTCMIILITITTGSYFNLPPKPDNQQGFTDDFIENLSKIRPFVVFLPSKNLPKIYSIYPKLTQSLMIWFNQDLPKKALFSAFYFLKTYPGFTHLG